jgi:hypothetical protein
VKLSALTDSSTGAPREIALSALRRSAVRRSRDVPTLRHPVRGRGNVGDLREHTAGIAPGNKPVYELGFSMRSFIAILFLLVALWQVTGGMQIDLATAMLAISAAWFLSLFVGD